MAAFATKENPTSSPALNSFLPPGTHPLQPPKRKSSPSNIALMAVEEIPTSCMIVEETEAWAPIEFPDLSQALEAGELCEECATFKAIESETKGLSLLLKLVHSFLKRFLQIGT
eukprot:CAMPEP_0170559492 /NCGR_PEP_ID=MMETSP0211-20121228/43122_1 /TAXON_ID=311385 /ORGANISM="Pseudokeronopsis sp., Strain OXSARD2" /LENGTH=113 /DNA_ID=CAMNT_0010872591 /DNA_START=29 /DNA_END=371 /DNA_ORIENTATION=+